MNVAPATAVQVPPELAERARREARADAEAKMKAAMESIMYAQQILQDCGDDGIADLQLAMELLQADTDPLAQGAVQAQQLLHQVLLTSPAGAQKAMKKADRDARDIVMLRCRAVCCDPNDRDEYLGRAAAAYGGGELDKEVRSKLLLSYHKDHKNQRCGKQISKNTPLQKALARLNQTSSRIYVVRSRAAPPQQHQCMFCRHHLRHRCTQSRAVLPLNRKLMCSTSGCTELMNRA